MQQYGLDGVACSGSRWTCWRPTLEARNIVLANVRQAAEDNGRVFFVMYDLTGLPNSKLTPSRRTGRSSSARESPAALPICTIAGIRCSRSGARLRGPLATPSDTLNLLKSLDKASAKTAA